jgi:site-specific recombinase XerD
MEGIEPTRPCGHWILIQPIFVDNERLTLTIVKTLSRIATQMPRDPDKWPILREYKYPSGKSVWMVDCGLTQFNGKPKRERYFYELKKEAETKRDLLRTQRENEGLASFELTPAERDDAKAALEILRPHGANLRQVARFYVENMDVLGSEKLVPDVVKELLEIKRQDGRSDRYIRDIRVRLNAFANAFSDRLVHEVKTAELEDYLRALRVGPVSRNNVKRLLGVLFSFAVKRRYALRNPAVETERATVSQEKPGILTVPEATALLQNAEPDILPALALGLFAGLRPEAEIWRLDWSQVNLKQRLIDVGKSKNIASHRFVKVAKNLADWLKPHAETHGPVSPQQTAYFDRVRELREKAGKKLEEAGGDAQNLRDWASDCLRHSYASYHFARFKKANETAEQLGHGGSLTMFYRHYRNRVKESDAFAFWRILPDA